MKEQQRQGVFYGVGVDRRPYIGADRVRKGHEEPRGPEKHVSNWVTPM